MKMRRTLGAIALVAMFATPAAAGSGAVGLGVAPEVWVDILPVQCWAGKYMNQSALLVYPNPRVGGRFIWSSEPPQIDFLVGHCAWGLIIRAKTNRAGQLVLELDQQTNN